MTSLDIERIVGITWTTSDDAISGLSIRYCDGRQDYFEGRELPAILEELRQHGFAGDQKSPQAASEKCSTSYVSTCCLKALFEKDKCGCPHECQK